MSDKFNGFSQDEINKVAGVRSKTATEVQIPKKEAFRSQHVGIRRMPEKGSNKPSIEPKLKQKQQVGRVQAPPIAKSEMNIGASAATTTTSEVIQSKEDNTMDEVNLDRSMSTSLEEALFYKPKKANANKNANYDHTTPPNNNDSSILKMPATSSSQENIEVSTATCSIDDTMNNSSILPKQHAHIPGEVSPLELNLDSPFKGVSLKDFETHRKMIEEQNKQKKEMLYKAIEQHSQKTAAEARKIEEIRNELVKLDNDLAVDVAILRKQIDNACIQFATVEKQYIKIEAQFLKSKMELHNAAEKKELLTEHLCTVIAHNEDRKAQKLSELMQKVGLTPTGEYVVSSSTPTPTTNTNTNGTN